MTTTTPAHGSHGQEVLHELSPLHRELRRAIPDVYQGFGELHRAAFTPGALGVRTKELIALAIGVVEGCDGCIASHAQAAVRAGATREEAAEAIGVTFLMKGGPATIHGPRAYAAFCSFLEDTVADDAAGAPPAERG
ncbi:carboxymuconolactone decarboxylase family protein [Marmoricola sp. RAF53]|uniref:carboxymuconolactone decarboxylase family protein n=1 Tax=Marmoricola sp. RAF53 TaxID=3233059 RepID=UPI003F95FD67